MNSLVGYGVSSESDSGGEVEEVNNRGARCVEEASDEAANKTRNFLEAGTGSASSDSGSESEPDELAPDFSSSPSHVQTAAAASSAAYQPNPTASSLGSVAANKLPPPLLNACTDSGVFANPFKAQADQRLSALQKHVPLTMQAKPSQIGGKRVCVSYRKDRRCRFGIKCKFAHDSDLQTPATPNDSHPPAMEDASVSEYVESRGSGSSSGGAQTFTKKEEEPGGQQVKKRRVGLSNTLIPPKRAMKQYTMHRDRERINMS